ncbi:hypothetical protein GOODEAATRI_018063 [Goodea atripinnis]|uniref:Uncharacterized protein n=1 Tax=Goodea atripinnis TaxID=208336 RepID=A0ABV0NVR3_9TELE
MGATVFVQPLDLVKNRMQLSGQGTKAREYKTSFHALFSILKTEGALIGMTAGATGAFVGTPAEGCVPTMARAVVVNAAQLASYSQSKQALLDSGYFGDDILCHFCASMISGLVTTAASMPVDIVKTRICLEPGNQTSEWNFSCFRIQNMRMIDGKPEYKNGLVSFRTRPEPTCVFQDVLMRVIGKEGFFSLWKGFTPYYARLGPHTVLTFIFLEQMNRLYKTYVLDR